MAGQTHAKIVLFNEISKDDIVYHDVDSYQSLLNIMDGIKKVSVQEQDPGLGHG